MAFLKQVLVELYEREGRKSLRVIPGQGYDVKNIRFPKEGRDDFAVGSVFKLDLRDHSTGKFYIEAYPRQTLAAAYFAGSVDSPSVKELVMEKGSAAPAPVVHPEDGVPPIPVGIQIEKDSWMFLNNALQLNHYPLLLGPKGCGKSSVAKALAEANGYDFYEFDLGQVQKPKRFFLGGLVIGEEGKTNKVRSEFFTAFTSEKPTLIFLDEITRTPGVTANFLMTILARNQSFIYDDDLGKRYYKGENVHFIAAGNVGYSYVSTGRLDSAFEDRFIKMQISYLTEEQETRLIMHRNPTIDVASARQLARVAAALRRAESKKTLTVSLSTRQVLDAAAYVCKGWDMAKVVERVILTNYIIADELSEAQAVLQAL
jgi:nitric oxide reductase NorQ protein